MAAHLSAASDSPGARRAGGPASLALTERSQLWQRAFALAHDGARTWDTVLEFVPANDPVLLAAEATLRQLIDDARRSLGRSVNEKRE